MDEIGEHSFLFLSVAEDICIHSVTCRLRQRLYVCNAAHCKTLKPFHIKFVIEKANLDTPLYSLQHPWDGVGERLGLWDAVERKKQCTMQSMCR